MATATGEENNACQPGDPRTHEQENDVDVDDVNEDIDCDDWPSQEYSDWDPEYDGEDIDNSDILETQQYPNEGAKGNDASTLNKAVDSTPHGDSGDSDSVVTPGNESTRVDDQDTPHHIDNKNNKDSGLEEFKNDPIGVESALIAITRPEEKKYYDGEGILSTKFGGDHDDNKDDEKKQGFQCWQCPICQSINSLVFDTCKKRTKK